MQPEKEIVNAWLNQQGFFTINTINAGHGRSVDLIAIRGDEVWHVEVHAAISSPKLTARERDDLQLRFTSAPVLKAISAALGARGIDGPYEQVLVSTTTAALPGVRIIGLDEVLLDVLSRSDRSSHKDATARTLQLIKFLLLKRPKMARKLIGKTKAARVLPEILGSEAAKGFLRSKAGEQLLLEILSGSTLASSEKLVSALAGDLLTKRAKAALVRSMLPKMAVIEDEPKDIGLEKFI